MRFLSLLAFLAISNVSASSVSSSISSEDIYSTVNRAGGWGNVDMSLEAGRFEPHHAHQWHTLAEPAPAGTPHFNYDLFDEEAGPSVWSKTPAWAQCAGLSQSPVALPSYMSSKPDRTGLLQPITPLYGAAQPANTLSVRNTGHALQVNIPDGLWLKGGALGANPYKVLQMHMHGHSEHSVGGAVYPLEIHIVHSDPTRDQANDPRALAVLGILVQESPNNTPNPALFPLTALLPNFNTTLQKFNASMTIPTAFSLMDLLPTNKDYYHYNGSLTTPPCSEQVVWHVLTTPIFASRAQILALTAPFGMVGNARPTQAIGTRSIVATSFQTTPNPFNPNSASTLTITFASVMGVIMTIFNMQ